jgi:hypothetical protein
MIHGVDFDLSPIAPGEARDLSVDSDNDVEVVFYCYRDPPGQFVVCGKIRLRPNETKSVAPAIGQFPRGAGRWRLAFKDLIDSDTEVIELTIVGQAENAPPATFEA